tara:strand:- start:44 stop:1231 length:1188 start_codon:yes stop_codon:yes gene_type:complete
MPGHHGGPSISGSKPKPKPSKPSSSSGFFGSMYTSPGSSTQQQGPPNLSSVGFNEGQVDPGLASGVMQAGGMSAQQANQIAQQAMGNTGQGFGITGTGNFDTQDTSGSGTDTSGSDQGTDSSDTSDEGEGLQDIFLNKIFGSQINRLTSKEMKRVKSILSQYISLGETNPLKLRALMTSNVLGGLFGKDQRFSDMDGNIIDEKDIVFKDGQMFTKDGKPIRTTKEGTIDLLKEEIGSEGIQSLKKFNPELYYSFQGMPQTTGGLEDLARLDTKGLEGTNPDLVKMIFNARAILDQNKGNQSGGGAGIPSLPNTLVEDPNMVDTDTIVTARPVADLTPTSTTPTGVASLTPTSLDYASIAPQFSSAMGPQYVNQGINDPRFAQYYQNLSDYYGYNA